MNKSKATTASRVASEVAAIRAALKKRGYRTRKCPKKPTWIIFVNAQCYYLLTYQPAPVSAWVIHPQGKDTDRHAKDATTSRFAIETIIQRAIPRRAS